MDITVQRFKNMILKGGYKRVCNSVSTIKLRPNDQEKMLGTEGYINDKKAVEEILRENYSNDNLLNRYYTDYDRVKQGWMDFNRWLIFEN